MIPIPEKLIISGANKSTNWNIFKQTWNNFEIATGLQSRPEDQRLATLLSVVGNEALVVYNAFTWQENEIKSVETVIRKFEAYCKPKRNVTYERFIFNSRKQLKNESIDEYIVTLRNLITNCEYQQLTDSLLKDAIVMGIRCNKSRELLLRESNLCLDKCIDILKSTESAQNHSSAILQREDIEEMEIDKVTKKYTKKHMTCKFCGTSHIFKAEHCPAFGKTCSKCNKRNHFAKVCKSKDIKVVRSDSENENEEFNIE